MNDETTDRLPFRQSKMSTSSVELLEGTPTSWRKESAVYLTERRSSLVDRNK